MTTNSPAHPLERYLLGSRDRLLAFIRSKVPEPGMAEDILQESLLRALRAEPGLRDEDRLVSWLYQIVRNAIADVYRRKGRAGAARERYTGEIQAEAALAADPHDEAVLCACFQGLIPTLKPEYAVLIERMELGGEDPEAVAESLGVSRNNLKVRRHRARQQLRERLEETCRTCAAHGCLDCTCGRRS